MTLPTFRQFVLGTFTVAFVSGGFWMLSLSSVEGGINRSTLYLTATSDDNSTAHLGNNTVTGLFTYDRIGDEFSNPTQATFTGWGYDGKKYVEGIEQTLGDLSYEANVLPSADIKGQEWVYTSSITESTASAVGSSVLTITKSATGGGNSLTYARDESDFGSADDVIFRTRLRITASNDLDDYSLGFFAEDGAREHNFVLQSDQIGQWNGSSIEDPFAIDTSQWRVYELVKDTANSTVTLYVDGLAARSLATTGFAASANNKISLVIPEDATTTVEIDYIRYDIEAQTFTDQPMADWYEEAQSSTRGGTSDFPEKVLIVSNEGGIDILNLGTDDREMWMRFSHGSGNALATSSGSVGVATNAIMHNGRLLVPRLNSFFDPIGFIIVDFSSGYTYQSNYNNGMQVSDAFISGRNNGSATFSNTGGSAPFIEGGKWVTAVSVSGTDYAAVVGDKIVALYNLETPESIAIYIDGGENTDFFPTSAYLTSDGDLYFVNSKTTPTTIKELLVFYDAVLDSGSLEWDTGSDHIYDTVATPEVLDFGNSIWVIEGASTVDGTSNVLLFGSDSGLSVIQEKQGDEANGTVVHYGYTGTVNGSIDQALLAGQTDRVYRVIAEDPSDVHVLTVDSTTNSKNALSIIDTVNNQTLETIKSTDAFAPSDQDFSAMVFGEDPTRIYVGHDAGIDELNVGISGDVRLSSFLPGAYNVRYDLVFSPLTPLANGSKIVLQFPNDFSTEFAEITASDVSVSGTNITGAAKAFDATQLTMTITLTTSAEVNDEISVVIGDGEIGTLDDFQNPRSEGSYRIGLTLLDSNDDFVDRGNFQFVINKGGEQCFAPLNEAYSWWSGNNTTADYISGNDVTFQGDATYGTGYKGNGFSFDGTGDYAVVPNESLYDFVDSEFAVSGWIKSSSSGTRQMIISKGGVSGYQWGVELQTTGHLLAGFFSTGGVNVANKVTDNPMNDGEWHHFVAIFDTNAASESTTLYVDGVEATADDGDLGGTYDYGDGPHNVLIGARNESSPEFYFTGEVDNIVVYDGALTEAEALALYNSGTTEMCLADTASTVCSTEACTAQPSDLLGWWDGDDITGSTANDLMENYDGTLTGDATTSAGYVDDAFLLDGTGDYVDLGDINEVDGASELTVSAWIKLDDLTRDHTIIAKDQFVDLANLVFFRDEVGSTSGRTDTLKITVGNGSVDTAVRGATDALNDTDWHHVAFTYVGGSATGLRMYVDGVEDPNSPADTTSLATLGSNALPMRIGAPTSGSGKDFDGQIDEVQVFTRSLSSAEILAIYNAGQNGVCKLTVAPVTTCPLSASGLDVALSLFIPESIIMTLNDTLISLRVDPSVNDGEDVSEYTELTVNSNAPDGYTIYVELDDGTGTAQLSDGNGNTIATGIGENNFGYEAKNAAYNAGESVAADSVFTNPSSVLYSNSTRIGADTDVTDQKHTVYYDVNVDYLPPAGQYSGTVIYTIVGNF